MEHLGTSSEAPAHRTERLTEASATGSLQQLVDSGQIERGCVTVIGLDAIRARLGAKWESRRGWVYETVERHIHRRLGDSGFSVRLGEVDIAVCVGHDCDHAKAISLNLLRELLDFFLGSQRFEDMRIASVIWVRGDQIGCAELDPRKIEPIEEARSFGAGAGKVEAAAARPAWSVMSFSTGDGRRLDLDLGYEPVVNLRNRVPVATRIRPLTKDGDGEAYPGRWIEKLAPADQSAVIEAIGDAAAALYVEGEVGLVIPCSIYTLATARNRALVVEKMQAVEARPAKPVVIELTDVDQGTPQGRLLEAVSLLAPHCRTVIARGSDARPDVEVLRAARLGGMSVDCTGFDLRDVAVKVAAVANNGRPVGSLLFAFGLSSDTACEIAAAAGATHGGLGLAKEAARGLAN
ncbi:MAG TPA: hypothetical protein VL460_05130 [Caulobacteraceae bacterium]|jgi:hypothetical protein|nr:hypothetical protein [Caulobacteraceae bacterium]